MKSRVADPAVSGVADKVTVVPVTENTVGLLPPPAPPLPTRTPVPPVCDTTNPVLIPFACA